MLAAAAIAIVTFWAALAPAASISLVFIPMKAWTAVGLVAAFDTYNAVSGKVTSSGGGCTKL